MHSPASISFRSNIVIDKFKIMKTFMNKVKWRQLLIREKVIGNLLKTEIFYCFNNTGTSDSEKRKKSEVFFFRDF